MFRGHGGCRCCSCNAAGQRASHACRCGLLRHRCCRRRWASSGRSRCSGSAAVRRPCPSGCCMLCRWCRCCCVSRVGGRRCWRRRAVQAGAAGQRRVAARGAIAVVRLHLLAALHLHGDGGPWGRRQEGSGWLGSLGSASTHRVSAGGRWIAHAQRRWRSGGSGRVKEPPADRASPVWDPCPSWELSCAPRSDLQVPATHGKRAAGQASRVGTALLCAAAAHCGGTQLVLDQQFMQRVCCAASIGHL